MVLNLSPTCNCLNPFAFWCKARNPCLSLFYSFSWTRKKIHGTNNGRFHRKPRHSRTDEGMDFQRNRTGERSLALAAAPFLCDLCSTSLSLFLFFFVFQEKDGERETDFMTVMADGKCTDDDDDNDDACVALVSLCRSLA